MRYILLPAPLTLRAPGMPASAGVDQSFDVFVRHLLDTDQRFNSSGRGIRMAVRIEQATRGARIAIALEEDDWQQLRDASENPGAGYPNLAQFDAEGKVVATISVARQYLPFIEAIADAKTEKPAALVAAAS